MKSYIFSALFPVLCLTACITAKCPGYDLNDFRLISFRLGDTLIYVSDQLDTILLVVNDFYSKGYYEFSSYPDYECDLDTYYKTDTKRDMAIKEHITYGMSIQFCNDYEYQITFGNYIKKGDYEMEVSDTTLNDLSCRKYFVKDLSFKRRINSFVKVDFCGIIEFHDKITDLTWRQVVKD
jgi:hypothetical protein